MYLFSVLYVLGVIRTCKGGVGHKTLSCLYYISSLCSGGFTETPDMCSFGVCWGHDTEVSRTGMCTVGFGNSTCLLLRVAER